MSNKINLNNMYSQFKHRVFYNSRDKQYWVIGGKNYPTTMYNVLESLRKPNEVIIAQDNDNKRHKCLDGIERKTGKKSACLVHRGSLVKLFSENKYLYEVLQFDDPSKVYIDIDCKGTKLNNATRKTIKKIEDLLGVKPEERYWSQLTSKRFKDGIMTDYTSAHILYNRKFENGAQRQEFKKWLNINNVPGSNIDCSVYGKNQCFRALHQSKRHIRKEVYLAKKAKFDGDLIIPNVLKVLSGTTGTILDRTVYEPVRYILHHTKNDCPTIDIDKFIVTEEQKKNTMLVSEVHTNVKLLKNPAKATLSDLLEAINPHKDYICMRTQWRYMVACIINNWTWQRFWKKFNRGYEHTKSSTTQYWEKEWKKKFKEIVMNPQRQNVSKRTILDIYVKQYGHKQRIDLCNVSDMIEMLNIDSRINLLLDEDGKPRQRIEQGGFRLEQITRKHKVIGLYTGLGTGKTYSVSRFIRDYKQKELKCLWITNRRALADAIRGAVNSDPFNLGFLDYRDDKTRALYQLDGLKRLICEVESLWKFKDFTPDVLIIDEIDSTTWSYLTDACHPIMNNGNTYKVSSYGTNAKMLIDTIKNTKYVFFMDALMTNRTIDFVSNCRAQRYEPDEPFIIGIKSRNFQKNKIVNYKNIKDQHLGFYSWFYQAVKMLKNGKRVIMFYPYKTGHGSLLKLSMPKLAEMLLHYSGIEPSATSDTHIFKKALLYFSNSVDGKERGNLQNVEQCWKKYPLVISNSCITAGVSYNPDDEKYQFDAVFLAYADFNSPREIAQFSWRARKIKSKTFYLCEIPNKLNVMKNKPVLRVDIPLDVKAITQELHSGLVKEYEAKNMDVLKYMMTELCGLKWEDITEPPLRFIYDSNNEEIDLETKFKQIKRECIRQSQFDYDCIQDLTENEIAEYTNPPLKPSQVNQLPVNTQMSIDKYYHTNKFKDNTERLVVIYWWENRNKLNTYLSINTDVLLTLVLTPTDWFITTELKNSLVPDEHRYIYTCEDYNKMIKITKRFTVDQIHKVLRRITGTFNRGYNKPTPTEVFSHRFRGKTPLSKSFIKEFIEIINNVRVSPLRELHKEWEKEDNKAHDLQLVDDYKYHKPRELKFLGEEYEEVSGPLDKYM